MQRHNGYGWVTDGASNIEELTVQLHGVMLRRTKDQVLCLPPKVRTFFEVEVPEGTATRETFAVLELLLDPALRTGRPRANRALLIAELTKVRHALAKAKVKATIDFVEGTVAQGEKVIVFSSFDEPLKRIANKFGKQAVLLSGKTTASQRQKLVDRFQTDPEVRVVANLIAGGVGINLTAGRLVVFNDLDWVPANHWRAEDQAYRIGQKGNVHVAYLVAAGTVDTFVRTVLQTKTRLVEAVYGKALQGDAGLDVLGELERLMREISPGIADETLYRRDPEWLRKVLERAASVWREKYAHAQDSGELAQTGSARNCSNCSPRPSPARPGLAIVAQAPPNREASMLSMRTVTTSPAPALDSNIGALADTHASRKTRS